MNAGQGSCWQDCREDCKIVAGLFDETSRKTCEQWPFQEKSI